MRIIAETKPIIDAVSLVARIAKSRFMKHRPILGCARIVATEKRGPIQVQAHNGEVWVSVGVPQVDVQIPGECAVDATMLARAIANAGDVPTVTLDGEDADKLAVRGDSCVTTLYTHPVKDFPPPIDIGADPSETNLGAGEALLALNRASATIGTDNSSYSFMGVLFKRDANGMDFVATDGRAMTLARARVPKSKAVPASAIVPEAAVSLMRQALGVCKPEEPVSLRIGDGAALVTDTMELRCLPIDGKFVSYMDHFPAKGDTWFEVKSDQLATLINGASMFVDEGSRAIVLTPNGKEVSVGKRRAESGEFTATMEAEVSGKVAAFGTAGKYVLAAMTGAGTPVVRIESTAPGKPLVVRTTDESFIAVWMPVSIA